MERYEIEVVGHLDQRRARAMGCEQLRLLPSGGSVLTFVAVDQAALYGLLGRLRDAGLELVAAGRIPGPSIVERLPRGAEPGRSDRSQRRC
jgi:hypothetical protein